MPHLAELGEHQRLLAGIEQVGDQLVEAGELARATGQLRAVAQRVGGVVADLLQPGERGQHEAAAAHAGGLLRVGEQLVDDGLVHVRLLAGERRPRHLLHLVGQVGHERLVGLRAPQQERPGEPAQLGGGDRVVLALDRVGEVLAELGGVAQQAGGDDLEDAPQLGEAVLHRGAGERDALAGRAARAWPAAVRVSGFFTACASSSTAVVQPHLLQRVEVAGGHLVGGDHQVVLRRRR
ncbi:MAG: hypothetical protein V9H26_08140 [Verrucomicrobiota bacterium]